MTKEAMKFHLESVVSENSDGLENNFSFHSLFIMWKNSLARGSFLLAADKDASLTTCNHNLPNRQPRARPLYHKGRSVEANSTKILVEIKI